MKKKETISANEASSRILTAVGKCLERQFVKYGIPPSEVYKAKPSESSIIGKIEDPIFDAVVRRHGYGVPLPTGSR